MRMTFARLAPARGNGFKTARNTLASIGGAAAGNAQVGKPAGAAKTKSPPMRPKTITVDAPKSPKASKRSKSVDTSARATSKGRGAASKLRGPDGAKLGGAGLPKKAVAWSS